MKPKPQTHFPATRMRRNRRTAWSRRLVQEHTLSTADLIWPLFLTDGTNKRVPISAMPGVDRISVDLVPEAASEAARLGIPVVALFPYTEEGRKTEDGREALNPENLVCRATRAVKEAKLDVGVLCDVALDPYTSHGHDGLLRNGTILNDETVEVLVQQALCEAQAGADIIAP